MSRTVLAAIVLIAGACRLDAQQSVLPLDPSDARVRIDGATEMAFADAIETEAAKWVVNLEAPPGEYQVSWSVDVTAEAALRLKGELFQGGAGQNHRLHMTIRGGGTNCFVASDQTGEWQVKQTTIFDPVRHVEALAGRNAGRMTLRFHWSFNKPGRQPAWRTGLRGLVVEPTDAAELAEVFCAPMAEGFPPVALPPARGIEGDVPWKVIDNVLTKNGEPFFPIGFVFGTDDRTLGQVRAMGANAVHTVISWRQVMHQPVPDPAVVENTRLRHARIGRWGLAGLPLVEGHYVPDWFGAAHPQDQTSPLGADGNKTGSWFPYSIHYEPMRAAMKQFWQALAPAFGREPSVLAVITWNEPIYGGHFAKPRQFADYRDFAVADYRTWLQTQYASLAALNDHWGSNHAWLEQIEPPRGPDETNRRAWYDWARYGQGAFAGFFKYIGDSFHEEAPDLWMIHKPTDGPFDGWACSSGTNYYLMGRSSPHVFGFDAYTSTPGTVALARAGAEDGPVFQLETNSIPPTAAARNPLTVRNWMWNFMIGGLRGMFIFAMSPGQYGLLNDAYCNAETRPAYAQFVGQVSDHGHVLALNDAPARIAVLHSNDAVLHYPGQRPLYPGPAFGAYHLVKNSHFNVVFLPQERCTLEVLSQYEVLVLPSYTILPDDQIKSVERFVDAGGKLLVFSHALAKNEYFEDLAAIPPVLGVAARAPLAEPPTVSVQDAAIAPYVEAAFGVNHAERIETPNGRVLAATAAGRAAAVLTRGGSVVYCAWRSDHDEQPRRFVEGILREVFGVKQTVRLVSPDDPLVACGAVGSRLIRGPGRDGTYHLLVFNGGDERSVRLDSRVHFERERFHGAQKELPTIELREATAYLFSQGGEQ